MRGLQRKYGVTWQTVRKALDLVWPEPRKKLPPRPTRLDPYKPLIDEMLRRDLDAPPKQRHTAKRVFDRLLDEYAAMGISYQMVRGYIATRRGEIRQEAGRGPSEVFVPQTHLPGTEAEVDFGDVHIVLGGVVTRCLSVLLPAVVFGQGGPSRVRVLRSGGVLRGPRARADRAGRCPSRQGPLRQPEGRRRPGARIRPAPPGERTVDRVSHPLGHRELLLQARTRRRPREGRRRRTDRVLQAQPLRPRSRGRLAGRAQRNGRPVGP
jgi:hypothetical protein